MKLSAEARDAVPSFAKRTDRSDKAVCKTYSTTSTGEPEQEKKKKKKEKGKSTNGKNKKTLNDFGLHHKSHAMILAPSRIHEKDSFFNNLIIEELVKYHVLSTSILTRVHHLRSCQHWSTRAAAMISLRRA